MMLCSGLSSTLLLAASCLLMTSGFSEGSAASIYTVTAISQESVITFNSLSVQHLSCERGVINVESAQNGNLDIIKQSCDGKKVCDISTDIIRSSDPGICKYLNTTYGCFPFHAVACEGSQANLQCGKGQVIVIHWANFGRSDKTTCSSGRPDPQLQNVHCSSTNSKGYVTNWCNQKNSCTVNATSAVFRGDPCGGIYKYLEVVYECQDPSPVTG